MEKTNEPKNIIQRVGKIVANAKALIYLGDNEIKKNRDLDQKTKLKIQDLEASKIIIESEMTEAYELLTEDPNNKQARSTYEAKKNEALEIATEIKTAKKVIDSLNEKHKKIIDQTNQETINSQWEKTVCYCDEAKELAKLIDKDLENASKNYFKLLELTFSAHQMAPHKERIGFSFSPLGPKTLESTFRSRLRSGGHIWADPGVSIHADLSKLPTMQARLTDGLKWLFQMRPDPKQKGAF